jgi:hypothetical protein
MNQLNYKASEKSHAIEELVGTTTNQQTNQPTKQATNQPSKQPTNQPTNPQNK